MQGNDFDCFLVDELLGSQTRWTRGWKEDSGTSSCIGPQEEDIGRWSNSQVWSPGLGKVWWWCVGWVWGLGGWGDCATQSALTDVLYIACYFILQEYWGVAKLKPGRYSNPSPAHISVGGWGLKSHLEVCSQYSSHPMLFMKGTSSRPLSRTHQSFSCLHATAPRPESPHRNTNTLTLWKNLNLD